jgi:hypothetical protein
MPHNSLQIVPGVDQNKTVALNQAGLSFTNLVRFVPDRNGLGLVQKLGGWLKYFPLNFGSYIRALWAWEDTNNVAYLALGAETSLSVIANANSTTPVGLSITPQQQTDNPAVLVATTSGSSTVVITDSGRQTTAYDSVYIQTPIAVGGIVITTGIYQITPVSASTYSITAVDTLGNPNPATSTTSGGAVPQFTTTNNSANVTVTLANHGYSYGSTFPVLVSTSVGGLTISGNYLVAAVLGTNTFVIVATAQASSSTSAYMNSGNARYTYYIGVGPLPLAYGYGTGGYGVGGYGTGATTTSSSTITAVDWTLDNWGEILISCPLSGPLYQWDPESGFNTAVVIPNAPPVNAGALIAMPQQQIVVWGSTFTGVQDPLLMRWCDVSNYNSWIGNVTNQAGSYRIPKGSKIVQCIQAGQQILIWTDLGVWAMQYVGQPYVYQFNELANGCGLIGRKAAASMNGTTYWMGQSQFYRLGSDGVSPIQCPVWDVIFQDLDTTNTDKIRIAPNSQFGEITWYYPTISGGGENTAYVKYNTVIGCWDYGNLSRTAWINQSVLGPPIGAGTDYFVYQHETSPDADGQPLLASFQTGYFAMSEGDTKVFVDQVWPDMKWGYFNGESNGGAVYQSPTATLQITFYTADYPGDTPIAYGPYTITQGSQYITPRFRARLLSIAISSSDLGSWWRIGDTRYRYQSDGRF